MNDDPEELLYNLGFGTQVSSPVDRIPSRFLHQSEVSGNDLSNFIVKQEEMWETQNMHLSGYHGLSGHSTNGDPVHGIVGKIHEKIRQRNRELKNSKRTNSFFNAAYSVMAARAFRNLVRQPAVNPTSILEPQNRDFLERQTETIQRRRKRPRLVLGKNSFVLDTDEELVDEEECASDRSEDSSEDGKRVVQAVGDAEVLSTNLESTNHLIESESTAENGENSPVESSRLPSDDDTTARRVEENHGSEKVTNDSGLITNEEVQLDATTVTVDETASVEMESIVPTLRPTENESVEETDEAVCQHLPATSGKIEVLSTVVVANCLIRKGSDSLKTSSDVPAMEEKTMTHNAGDTKINEGEVVNNCISDSGTVSESEDIPVESVELERGDEARKRWSERSDDQKRVGRVGRLLHSTQTQFGRGWVRCGGGGGWVKVEEKRCANIGNVSVGQGGTKDVPRPPRIASRIDRMERSVVEISKLPDPTLDASPETERRSHFKRQSGVDPYSIDSALDDLSLKSSKPEKDDHITELEFNHANSKNGGRRPPSLCSRVESGFVSCDLEYKDEMDIADLSDETPSVHSKHESNGGCDSTGPVTDPTSISSNGDFDEKISNQPSSRTSLHLEFLEKIRNRCRMTSSEAAAIKTTTSVTSVENCGSEVSVDDLSDINVVDAPPQIHQTIENIAAGDSSEHPSISQDRSRLDDFHEGCVTAVDRMQKSMQLYVKRLRTMEQAWGETYNKWFLASRKSEKRDLNQLANVHQSIMEEAQQTQALLLDHSRAIELAKEQSTCQAVDARLVVCSGQLRTVANDLDGIIREQDSMLRHMREMEEDVETTTDSDLSTCGVAFVNEATSAQIIAASSAPHSPDVTSVVSPLPTPPAVALSVSSPTQSVSPTRNFPTPSSSAEGIHKLLHKLKQEMTADIKSSIGDDCVRFEKDLKSTSQQMEDVKSFLSRMLSVIQTNK